MHSLPINCNLWILVGARARCARTQGRGCLSANKFMFYGVEGYQDTLRGKGGVGGGGRIDGWR